MSTIELSIETELSLQDIQAAHQSGQSVVRTAHIGNHRGYNLAVAAMDIPMQLVDHTIVAQRPGERGDGNYLPGSIVTSEGITPLTVSRIGGLALQTTVTDHKGEQIFLDQFHTRQLQQAFPDNTRITTNTEYIRAAEAISGEVARIALETSPELFRRAVESDGTVRKATFGSLAHLARIHGILQLNDDPHVGRGLLLPNEVDIIIGFVVEALSCGGDTQLHLSGPDFCNYSKDRDFQARLNKLYTAVRSQASFGAKLPETLHVKIIPATEARFVAALGRGAVLHEIFDTLRDEQALIEEKRTFFTTKPDHAASAAFIDASRQVANSLHARLGALAQSAPELFMGPQDAPYTSQYDILAAGGIDMPDENARLTMRELRLVHGKLTKAKGSTS